MRGKTEIILAMLLFGSLGLILRNIEMSSAAIALIRGAVGTLFLCVILVFKKNKIEREVLKKNLKCLMLSGGLLATNWILLFEAYRHTTIAIAVVTYYMAPVFLLLLSPIVLKESLTKKQILCIFCSIAGMICISGLLTSSASDASKSGILFGLLAAISYANLTITNKFLSELDSLASTTCQLGIATILLMPYCLWTGAFTGATITLSSITLLFVLGIFHTGIPFWLYFSSVKKLKAQTLAPLSYIDPVTAILLSSIVLREQMALIQAVGILLILGSALISQIQKPDKAFLKKICLFSGPPKENRL